MVGRDRYGGIFSSFKGSELVDVERILRETFEPSLGPDEAILDLAPPELLARIEDAMVWLNSDMTEERFWMFPREDEPSTHTKEEEYKFRVQAGEAIGETRKDMLVLQRAKQQLEAYIKKWYK